MPNANLKETAMAVGFVRLIKHDNDGRLVYDNTFKNQLTLYARQASANLWAGSFMATPSHIQVGIGSPTYPNLFVDSSDTELWDAVPETLKQCNFVTTWLTYNTQYSVTYEQSEANYQWTELGLLDANGNLWSHVQLTDFVKDFGETVTVQWQIQHIAN